MKPSSCNFLSSTEKKHNYIVTRKKYYPITLIEVTQKISKKPLHFRASVPTFLMFFARVHTVTEIPHDLMIP